MRGGGVALALFLPSLEGGGAQRVMLNLAAGFAARGIRTDLVLARAEGAYLSQVPADVRIVDLDVSRGLKAIRPLRAYLRRARPSALLAAQEHGVVIAMIASRLARTGTRTVISIHNTLGRSARESGDLRDRIMPWLIGRIHRWADGIVAVSEGVADDLALTTATPRARIEVIYNPVITPALEQRATEPAPHPWFADPSRPVVLGIGRLEPQKNFAGLVEAFAIVRRDRDVRLVILGDGSQRAALEALVDRYRLGDSVALPGFVDNPYSCIARAAVFALSSDWEGLPTVLIESLALGTAVVSTDCQSGPREILRGGALGGLVPTGDVAALARAIETALTTPRHGPPPDLQAFTLDRALDRYQHLLGIHA